MVHLISAAAYEEFHAATTTAAGILTRSVNNEGDGSEGVWSSSVRGLNGLANQSGSVHRTPASRPSTRGRRSPGARPGREALRRAQPLVTGPADSPLWFRSVGCTRDRRARTSRLPGRQPDHLGGLLFPDVRALNDRHDWPGHKGQVRAAPSWRRTE